jgi:hypothetical protein
MTDTIKNPGVGFLPPNKVTLLGGISPSPSAQSAAAMKANISTVTNLRNVTTGGGPTIQPLQSSIRGPAGATLGQAFKDAQQNAVDAQALSVGDKMIGGKRRRHWSLKYKKSINCRRPKGFSQRQHCKYGRKTKRRHLKKRSRRH